MNDKTKKRCIRGAIFDVDGTLLDSMKIWDNAGERYLQSRGRQAEPGLSRILFSMSLADGATYLKETYELPETTGEIHQGILDIVDAFYHDEAQAKAGVRELLEALSAKGVALCTPTKGMIPLEPELQTEILLFA